RRPSRRFGTRQRKLPRAAALLRRWKAAATAAALLNLEPLHLQRKPVARETEEARGLAAVAAGAVQGLADQIALQLAHPRRQIERTGEFRYRLVESDVVAEQRGLDEPSRLTRVHE